MSAFDIKPEWLVYLQTVAREKHMRSAAEKLYLTEQTLRYNLKALEDALQVPLLRSTDQGLGLTSQGQALLDSGQVFLSRLEAVQNRIQALSEIRPELRLAVAYAFPSEALADLLAELYQRFPGLQLTLELGSPRELEKLVAQGMYQLGLLTVDGVHPRLQYVKGPESPGIYVRHASLPVEPLYLLPQIWRYNTYPSVDYPPEVAAYPVRYLGRIPLIRSLCLLGAGIGYLPRLHVQGLLEAGLLVETGGPPLDYSLHTHLAFRDAEHLHPPARYFCERLQQIWSAWT